MYGSMSYMMITTGKGVAGFTLDPTLGGCPPPHCRAAALAERLCDPAAGGGWREAHSC